VGQALCKYVLKANGKYVARSMVCPTMEEDYTSNPTNKSEMKDFDQKVKEHIGEVDSTINLQTKPEEPKETLFVPLVDGNGPSVDEIDDGEYTESPFFDPLLRAKDILLHKDGDMIAR
jgi:hypothetical protein